MDFEVDVQPLDASVSAHPRRLLDQACADPLPAHLWVDARVKDEAVRTSVPRNFHEPDKMNIIVCAYVREAMSERVAEISKLAAAPRLSPQRVQLVIIGKRVNLEQHHLDCISEGI